jgi:hypothetical protein
VAGVFFVGFNLLNIYTSSRIETALKENIYFMWISDMSQPDHNTINRFRSERFQAVNCHGCSLRGVCHNRKGNRTIEDNHRLRKPIQKARELLLREQGKKHRKQRPADVEPVFGNIKQNKGLK